MSRTLAFLRQAQEQRESIGKDLESPVFESSGSGSLHNLIYLVFGVLLLLNIALSINMLNKMKLYSEEKSNTIVKLAKMEQAISNSSEQISTVNSDLKHLRADVNRMQKSIDTQALNIQSLTKSKNILYNKVADLEAQIDKGLSPKGTDPKP